MPAAFRTPDGCHVHTDIDIHASINDIACRMRGLSDLAASLRAGETRHSAAAIRVAVARLSNALSDYWAEIGDATDGAMTNTEGGAEGYLDRALAQLAQNQSAAASRRTALDAGVSSFVGS